VRRLHVHVDGTATRSRVTPLSTVSGVVIEGLGTDATPHPLQTAFIEEQARQCGITNGTIMQSAHLLARKPKPSEQEAVGARQQSLRCGTHLRIVRAVTPRKLVAGAMNEMTIGASCRGGGAPTFRLPTARSKAGPPAERRRQPIASMASCARAGRDGYSGKVDSAPGYRTDPNRRRA
jgi:hypothetical protein